MQRIRLVIVAAALLLAAACSDATGPEVQQCDSIPTMGSGSRC